MTDITTALLNSGKIRQLFHTHCVEGNKTSLTIGAQTFTAEALAKHYGVKLSKSTKYKVEKQHADMEHKDSSGDNLEHGSGDSQSTE